MLYLNESDIRRSISYESMMDTMEDALRLFARGEYVMADRLAVPGGDTTHLSKGSTFLSNYTYSIMTLG